MEYDYIYKIIIFGDGGVGKSSLTQRYLTNLFDVNMAITIGADFHKKDINIEGKVVRLQIWDFGGEERFRFLLPAYCRGARGGLFLYDVTNASSLEHLEEWMRIISEETGKIPILMVGSKADLIDQRKVSKQEAVQAAKAQNLAGYAEVSAKTGVNVEKTFLTIVQLMMKEDELIE